jgi:hypothetical protein
MFSLVVLNSFCPPCTFPIVDGRTETVQNIKRKHQLWERYMEDRNCSKQQKKTSTMGKVHGGQKLFKTSRENINYGKGTWRTETVQNSVLHVPFP